MKFYTAAQMTTKPLYLKSNVQMEPLIDHWYAWPHLIPPATASRNMVERHFRIMDSFVNAPAVHAAAVRNPRMRGGPFIDYPPERCSDINRLREWTRDNRLPLLSLSKALVDLTELLQSRAIGYSLQPLYSNVPPLLRGYVELVYDLDSHPSYRLFEALLYQSPYYIDNAQSILLSETSGDDRPFVLSTPRFEDAATVHLGVPFESDIIDRLFDLKRTPQPFNVIQEQIPVPRGKEARLRSFLTEESPPPYQSYTGPGVRWRYFGHACILIESKAESYLLDPVISYTYEADIPRYTYSDLPETIDYVLITHNHQDHVLLETLLQLRRKIKTIIVPKGGGGSLQDPSLRLILNKCGFKNVIELGELDSIETQAGSITGFPFLGEHSDLDVRTKLAYLVRLGTHSLLFAADSCNIEPTMYEHMRQIVGEVEVLFLGMECDGAPLSWLYGPLLPKRMDRNMDESRRLAGSNYEQAVRIVNVLGCKEVYVYAMGQEPWLNHVMSLKYTAESRPIVESNRLIEDCHARGLVAERLFGEKEILLP
jgi:L-ascorbate metabolism protein UlaG (beta-lactamase superfamily)